VLYRLKALGERHDMDITIEGFHSWMWKGLTFLLPFLLGGYVYQAYNSYILYKLSHHPDSPWQVQMLSILFFLLFIGNTWTTLSVIPDKLRGQIKEKYRLKSMSWAMKIRQQIKVSKFQESIYNLYSGER
jgi:D-alanyl-lipoteichoic acid acyltransferase DltB (MBOAT superfamily)